MPASYKSINYGLRPAKAIERKMICEFIRKLSVFSKLSSYRYIGFGSTYFSDFILFHKALGITDMISIEKDINNEKRFNFNRPFRCIDLQFGLSTEVITNLVWNVKTILWLDYDCKLNGGVLADIQFFFSNAIPCSVVIVTINVHPYDSPVDEHGVRPDLIVDYRLRKLKEKVGEGKVPLHIKGEQLKGWDFSKVCRLIIQNEIDETLKERNGTIAKEHRLHYKQLFHFNYADGAKMLTIGGLIFEEGQSSLVSGCGFENLPYIRTGEEEYRIGVPNLTFREIRHLDSQLPIDNYKNLKAPSIPNSDLRIYSEIYRYFPTFTEAEL